MMNDAAHIIINSLHIFTSVVSNSLHLMCYKHYTLCTCNENCNILYS